jgi:FtsZ-binding cell division protein ZapB
MNTEMLNRLEEKVRLAVQEIERLRRENRRLEADRGGKRSRSTASAALRQELRILQEERAALRTRVEGLIQSMEAGQ